MFACNSGSFLLFCSMFLYFGEWFMMPLDKILSFGLRIDQLADFEWLNWPHAHERASEPKHANHRSINSLILIFFARFLCLCNFFYTFFCLSNVFFSSRSVNLLLSLAKQCIDRLVYLLKSCDLFAAKILPHLMQPHKNIDDKLNRTHPADNTFCLY